MTQPGLLSNPAPRPQGRPRPRLTPSPCSTGTTSGSKVDVPQFTSQHLHRESPHVGRGDGLRLTLGDTRLSEVLVTKGGP